ncbi:hypothetical protein R6Q57_008235 [Mikania cordata]
MAHIKVNWQKTFSLQQTICMDLLKVFPGPFEVGADHTAVLQYNDRCESDGFEHSEGHMTIESEESEFPPSNDESENDEAHIEGWVRRMMFIRGANKRKNPSAEFDWTILPPQFHSEMYGYNTKFGSAYANGMNELYPPFWEVQYIYIPIYVQAIEDWLLVQINLCKMELTQYWCNKKYSKHYGSLIHYGVLQKFDMFFDSY